MSVEVTTWFYFFVRILPRFKLLLTAWRLYVQPWDAICWLHPHRSTEPLEGLQPHPCLPKAPSPDTVPLRFGSPAMNLGGDTQTPLAFWGKPYMVFWYFAEVSYVCTYKGYWSVAFFSHGTFVWLWYRDSVGFMK